MNHADVTNRPVSDGERADHDVPAPASIPVPVAQFDLPKSCPICDRPARFTLLPLRNGKQYDGRIFDGVTAATCSMCGSSWALNPPTNDDLGQFYNDNYKIARIGRKQKEEWPRWDSRAASLIALGRLFTPVRRGQIFLDIGPGGGEALGLASYLLPKPRLACIEFSNAAIKFYRSVLPQVYAQNSLDKMTGTFAEKVQFVYAAHSFEHFALDALKEDLARIRDLLTPTGVLVCEVPNVDKKAFRDAQNHVPHLIFFSRRGLIRMLRSCGFDVKLCIEAIGKHGEGNVYYENYRERAEQDGVPAHLVERLSAMNNGDWVGGARSRVIKCVATKARS